MSTLRETWRRVPVDVVAFVAIVLGIAITHLPVIRHGMCFNDPSWYFHFGGRVLDGDVPYRDFVFQVGPLPIYVDAAFQGVFGEKYAASLFAGLFVKILRVFVVWLIARRLAGVMPAVFLAIFCSFDPLFAFVHHWSTPYAQLAITASALFLLLAVSASGRRALIYVALAGFCAGFVVASRQASAIMNAVVLLPATALLLWRRDFFTRRTFAAFWIGFVAACLFVFAVIAAQGALGPAITQMFVEAAGKKGIRGVPAVLDAISGGGIVDGRYTYLTGFLFFIGLPLAFVTAVLLLARRDKPFSLTALALVAVIAGVCFAHFMRLASFEIATDLPRTFLSAVVALAVLSPRRGREWLGIEPIVVVGLGAMPLASDWALEMSAPGRGWGDVWSLVTSVILLGLASSHLSRRVKLLLCGGFALAAVVHVAVFLHADLNPFAKPEAADGTFAENSFAPHVRGKRSPVMRGLRVPEWRAKAVTWLASQVPANSTCFIYANLPSLYDILDCENPTKIDTTIADFPSAADARRAVAALKAAPPDVILAHDRMWMSPPISLDLGGDIGRYDSWNPKASFALHMGLRAIIHQYESLGTVGDAIGPELAKKAAAHWDAIDAIHVYRRKR